MYRHLDECAILCAGSDLRNGHYVMSCGPQSTHHTEVAAFVSEKAHSRLLRRAELTENETSMTVANDLAVRRALEGAGVEFIDENGGGPGVRLRKRQAKKA
jgi:hypothetical protein